MFRAMKQFAPHMQHIVVFVPNNEVICVIEMEKSTDEERELMAIQIAEKLSKGR